MKLTIELTELECRALETPLYVAQENANIDRQKWLDATPEVYEWLTARIEACDKLRETLKQLRRSSGSIVDPNLYENS